MTRFQNSEPNRRIHTRYQLPSMYTEISVREPGTESYTMTGHAYDISLGGMRFELDAPIEPGTVIEVRIELPGPTSLRPGRDHGICATAHVVWSEPDDLEDGGSVRMACVFHSFDRPGDEQALLTQISRGSYARAA